MSDLQFDPQARDLVITGGDFTVIDNPSVQNGARILNAHTFSIRYPNYGIGLQRLINADLSTVNFEMNRWVTQVKNDGAKKANFTTSLDTITKHVTVNTTVSYV